MLGIAYQNSTIFYKITTVFIDYTKLISIPPKSHVIDIPVHSIIRTIVTYKQLTAYYMYKHKLIVTKRLFNFSPQDLTEAGS